MSNITVPRAANRGGQSANLTRQPSSAAPALREAGAKLFTAATQARQQFEANELNQVQLDMTRELDALRLEYEQTTDPRAIETGWAARTTELRERFTGSVSAGLQNRVGLTFDKLAQSHALPVARHAQGMRVSQSAGTWRDFTLTVSNSYGRAGPETRDQLIAQGDEMIAADLDAGFISPEEAARRRQQLRVTGIEAEALHLVDTDPAAFLEAAEAGRFDPLGGDSVERLSARSRSAIASRAAAAETARQKAADAAAAQIGKDLSFIADLAGDGLTAQQEAAGFMDLPEVQAHPDYPMAAAAIQLREAIPDLNQLAPPALQALIAEQRATPLSEKWQAERIAVLEDLLETAQAEWTENPIARAQGVGIEVPPLDIAGLSGRAGLIALRDRKAAAEALAAQGYVPEPGAALFSDDERDALVARLDPARDDVSGPQARREREDTLRALVSGLGADALPALSSLEQSPGILRAAEIMLRGTPADMAFGQRTLAAVIRGEQKIAAETITLPPRQRFLATIDELTGGYYDDNPQAKAGILAAARAIYAADAEPLDPASDATLGDGLGGDEFDAFQEAVQTALGGATSPDGTVLGGLQEVRGATTELPAGVSAEAVETAWDAVIAQARGGVDSRAKDALPTQPSLDLLNRAAANGATVGDWASADTLAAVSFEPVPGAPGFYTLVQNRGGRQLVKPAADGSPFMLHLPTLLERAK